MKRNAAYLFALVVTVFLAACGSGGSHTKASQDSELGAVALSVDLSGLKEKSQSAKFGMNAPIMMNASTIMTTTTISAVTVTFSRSGYDDVVQDLTIADNVASGTVTGLAAGYWHILAEVYSGSTLIYTGSVDVNVIAGAQVAAEILFDPVESSGNTDTTGSVAVTVGLNKYPGYSKISQYVSTVLQDTAQQKIYIYDSSTCILAVYNADTMVREQDITLQAAPQALAVDPAGGSLLLGYSSGKIYRLTIADQSFNLLADALVSITALVPISSKYVLVASASGWSSSNSYRTINLENGQTVSSNSYYYPLSNFTYNQANGMVYALDSGLSPADMHHIEIDATTGTITVIDDSRYHGEYSFGEPIRIFSSGTRIATSSGNMFVSSSDANDNITYAGNLGHTFTDMVSDDTLGNIYMLNSDGTQKLLVIDQSSLFTTLTADLIDGPMLVFNTPNNIIVFAKPDTDYYVRVFSKSDLGLQ